LDTLIQYIITENRFLDLSKQWKSFLDLYDNQLQTQISIIFDSEYPTIIDSDKRKLRIDFKNDGLNYKKKKAGLQSESISRALGAGKKGLRVLDLSAGMGIDSVFLAQMGYHVTAIERNPVLFLALDQALQQARQQNLDFAENIEFIFSDAIDYLKKTEQVFDVCYFDPMFPQKKKMALPRQEMVLFKNLVGSDDDAADVLKLAINSKKFNRCVVKRPLSAQPLLLASGAVTGKIIRYDIYGGTA
jgi:16S rRNA (guanine1516-N2)-methyltransferase